MTPTKSELRESLGAFIDSDGVTILCLDGSELRLSAAMEIDLFNRVQALINKQIIEARIDELNALFDETDGGYPDGCEVVHEHTITDRIDELIKDN